MAKQLPKTPSIGAFTKRVKSTLWRKDKRKFSEWEEKVEALQKEGHTKHTAVVQASLGYPELKVLFKECDVSRYMLDPEQMCGAAIATSPDHPRGEVVCEGKKQSYIANLRHRCCLLNTTDHWSFVKQTVFKKSDTANLLPSRWHFVC